MKRVGRWWEPENETPFTSTPGGWGLIAAERARLAINSGFKYNLSIKRRTLVARWVVLKVFLVIVLGREPLVGRLNLGHDPLTLGVKVLCLDLGLDGRSNLLLLGRVVEDRRPVLRAAVRALTVNRRRVVRAEEELQGKAE